MSRQKHEGYVTHSGGAKPPGRGWASVGGSQHGGFRRRDPHGGWSYWYPKNTPAAENESGLHRSVDYHEHQNTRTQQRAEGGSAGARHDAANTAHHHAAAQESWNHYAAGKKSARASQKDLHKKVLTRKMSSVGLDNDGKPMVKGVDGFGAPARLVMKTTVRTMRKSGLGTMDVGGLLPAISVVPGSVRRVRGVVSSGEFDAAGLRCSYRLQKGQIPILTINGPKMPMPFHLIARGWAVALEKGARAALCIVQGKAPAEGVYRKTGARLPSRSDL